MLADPEEEVASAAAEALGRYVLLTEMSLFDKEEGSKIVEDLREMTSQDKPVELRAGAIESLASIDLGWVQPLILDAYYDSDDRMRLSAVRAMGRTASSSWLEYIYEQLEVEDPFFRLEAVLAIAEIADESSIDSLSILFEDEDAEIAETAVETVSLIGGEIAVSTLMEFLERADEKWVPVLEDAIKTASGQMGDTPFSSAGSI